MAARKEVITAETCRSCGVCCVAPYQQDTYCDVSAEDEKRLGKRFVCLHVLRPRSIDVLAAALDGRSHDVPPGAIKTKWQMQKSGPLKGYELLTCVALQGTVLSKTQCRVYENRPRACREAVKPGDRWCRELRRVFLDKVEDIKAEAG